MAMQHNRHSSLPMTGQGWHQLGVSTDGSSALMLRHLLYGVVGSLLASSLEPAERMVPQSRADVPCVCTAAACAVADPRGACLWLS